LARTPVAPILGDRWLGDRGVGIENVFWVTLGSFRGRWPVEAGEKGVCQSLVGVTNFVSLFHMISILYVRNFPGRARGDLMGFAGVVLCADEVGDVRRSNYRRSSGVIMCPRNRVRKWGFESGVFLKWIFMIGFS
jgi:hypothetical protein